MYSAICLCLSVVRRVTMTSALARVPSTLFSPSNSMAFDNFVSVTYIAAFFMWDNFFFSTPILYYYIIIILLLYVFYYMHIFLSNKLNVFKPWAVLMQLFFYSHSPSHCTRHTQQSDQHCHSWHHLITEPPLSFWALRWGFAAASHICQLFSSIGRNVGSAKPRRRYFHGCCCRCTMECTY